MDREQQRPPQGSSGGGSEAAAPPAPAVDVQQLADRVYHLLLAEARLARARGDPARRSGGS